MKLLTIRSPACALAVAMILSALTGCAGLPPSKETPSVTIAGFNVASISLFEQLLDLQLRIQNPNPDAFQIDGIAFDVLVNGQPFAKGVGNALVTVPRYGSVLMPVEAVTTLSSLTRQVRMLAVSGGSGFDYRIRGTLSLAGGIRVPFDHRGDFGAAR